MAGRTMSISNSAGSEFSIEVIGEGRAKKFHCIFRGPSSRVIEWISNSLESLRDALGKCQEDFSSHLYQMGAPFVLQTVEGEYIIGHFQTRNAGQVALIIFGIGGWPHMVVLSGENILGMRTWLIDTA